MQKATSPFARRNFLRRFVGAGAAAVAAVPIAAAARTARPGLEPFIGEIAIFAGTFAPRGWAFCEGQVLAISNYQALFAILGTNYGGDGRQNFKLPDLKKQSKQLGARYIIALDGIFPSRS